MNEIDDLLQRIDTPQLDVAADLRRGERALRRRHRWQVGGAATSVASVLAVVVAMDGGGGPAGSSDPGFAGQSGGTTSSSTTDTATTHHLSKQRRRHLAAKKARRALLGQLSTAATHAALQAYRDVLADHLDPGGTRLSGLSNEQSGGNILGTKLDWNGGGMVEIVVGRHWDSAESFYLLEDSGMRPTTYDGHQARVSTSGDDTVVSVQHADGTVVTLIASTSFGNNGTSTSSTGLTQQMLLETAADPRLRLPAVTH
jgi:hypothetical protein